MVVAHKLSVISEAAADVKSLSGGSRTAVARKFSVISAGTFFFSFPFLLFTVDSVTFSLFALVFSFSGWAWRGQGELPWAAGRL